MTAVILKKKNRMRKYRTEALRRVKRFKML